MIFYADKYADIFFLINDLRGSVGIKQMSAFMLKCRYRHFNIEHSFGHGDNGLANTLLTLNLIAFAFHGACDQLCALWYKARQRCSRRKRFFYTMDVLTEWWYFDNWYDLLI